MDDHSSQLVQHIRSLKKCVVAFSGGVDSAVVAKATFLALGNDNSLAVTAISPSVSSFELENAIAVARQIGIRHDTIQTDEINNLDYVANDGQRCFHCKSELYSKIGFVIHDLSGEHEFADGVILNGTNCDDLQDYRPGLRAAEDHSVCSPLAELGFGKSLVRDLARHWDLSVWDKPASPCLASRIAYGESVTVEKLRMIEAGEAVLRSFNFKQFRVRLLANLVAQLEVELAELERLREPSTLDVITDSLVEIGFSEVRVDPDGFQSGKLNQQLPTYEIGS